jgi:hypothetical protein
MLNKLGKLNVKLLGLNHSVCYDKNHRQDDLDRHLNFKEMKGEDDGL